MIKLTIDNVYIKIENIEKDVENILWNRLSFEIEEFGKEYTNIRHLYNRKTKKTYTGLLIHIIEIFNELGEDFEIIDIREKWEENANFKIVNNIILPNGSIQEIKLRPYQEDIVNKSTNREVIQAATGAGKTIIMAALIAKFNVKPVGVFADKISLCSQIKEEFEKFLGIPIGLVGGGIEKREDITIFSVQSTTEEDVRDMKMIMFDECLHGNTLITLLDNSKKTIQEIVEKKLKCEVITYNTEKKIFENNKIYNWQKIPLKNKNKKMMKVIIEDENNINHIIECTEDHKIWVESENRYIEAGKLIQEMEVICNTSSREVINSKVKSIEITKNVDYVYDISVENNHNFLANDVILSNCHHVPAETASEISRNAFNAYYRIGVSATPWRDGGDDLLIEACLNKRKPENAINATKLTDLGYLVPATIYFVPIKEIFKGKNYHDVYKKAIVENKNRNSAVVKIAQKMYERNSAILILIKQIEHGEILLKMLNKILPNESFSITVKDPKSNIDTLVRVKNIEFLSGKDDALRRKAVLQAVKENKCKILIGSTIADEGLDVAQIGVVILAQSGKSSTRAFQRIGRALRPCENKTRAVIFDFQDYTPMLRRHSRVREKLYKTEEAWDIKIFNTDLLKK